MSLNMSGKTDKAKPMTPDAETLAPGAGSKVPGAGSKVLGAGPDNKGLFAAGFDQGKEDPLIASAGPDRAVAGIAGARPDRAVAGMAGTGPDRAASVISEMERYKIAVDEEETGFVTQVGDGVARVAGLRNCESGEMLEFECGIIGMAINLEENSVGCVLLGDETSVHEGMRANRTRSAVSVGVGDCLVGRVVDALGRAVDGRGDIVSDKTRPIEFMAPGVNDRQGINTPMQTGIVAIDSMIPIGRGQRELIIGDRQTGKTTIAIDAIINQKGKGVTCIYVAIGQKASSIASIAQTLEKHGAMEYTIIVASTAGDPACMQYIAPYAGCAMAEEFMYSQKKDVLIVYDDLTKHAVAYRSISLILKRPPGREAYPGDVFYLHSRLLERAARLSDELGGGSITALPIIETQGGDFSAYVPTNVVSITDGQIYLQPELFFSGQRPAINVGISVSRVGGAAQTKAMKKVSGSLRINLAQYRELEVFAQFGSDLDVATQNRLAHGERIVESLKQMNQSPLELEDQVILLYTVSGKELMGIPTKQLRQFNSAFMLHMAENLPQVLDNIRVTGQLSPDDEECLKHAIEEFKEEWLKPGWGKGRQRVRAT